MGSVCRSRTRTATSGVLVVENALSCEFRNTVLHFVLLICIAFSPPDVRGVCLFFWTYHRAHPNVNDEDDEDDENETNPSVSNLRRKSVFQALLINLAFRISPRRREIVASLRRPF